MNNDPRLTDIDARRSRYMDSLLTAFEQHLRELVSRVQAKIAGRIGSKLSIAGGVVDQTAGNLRILRSLGREFAREMDRAGYGRLVEAFVGEFPRQLPFLEETLDLIGQSLKTPVRLSLINREKDLLAGFQVSASASLDAVISQAGEAAVSRALFSVGGLPFDKLVDTLVARFETSVPRAMTLAETAMATFYRTATDLAFQEIEQDLPEQEQRYRYYGPDDKLTRPFCHRLLNVKKPYSREEIGGMDNGQLPNVFLTAGGFNCRHAWILDVETALRQAA